MTEGKERLSLRAGVYDRRHWNERVKFEGGGL